MFLPDGTPRGHYEPLHEALTELSSEELVAIQERVTRSFSDEGITFTVYGDEEADERIIPIDCLPRVMSGAGVAAPRSGSNAAPEGPESLPG